MDQWLLLFLKFVRMLAYGLTTMVIVPFMHEIGCSDPEIGLFMTLTLLGDVILSTVITFGADQTGRRFMLGLSSILMLLSGVCFMFCTQYWILLVAAILGVISPSGDEVGPFRAIEEAAIAQISKIETRSRLYAWQNLLGTLGLSLGSLLGGWMADVFAEKTGKRVDAYRVVFFGYVMCALASFIVAAKLTEEVEVSKPVSIGSSEEASVASVASAAGVTPSAGNLSDAGVGNIEEIAPEPSTSVAPADDEVGASPDDAGNSPFSLSFTLCLLFGIDSLAYSFMTNSWLVEYMLRTFHTGATAIGAFFSVSTFISALTSFPSAWFTDYVGPVPAISLTKLGAGLFGGLVPLTSHQYGAMALIWLRSLFDTMDVVPRQMFITSVVAEAERTRVLGLVNVVKTLGRSVGPTFTGWFASHGHLNWCFAIMGSLEWVFAFAVYGAFRNALDNVGPIHV